MIQKYFIDKMQISIHKFHPNPLTSYICISPHTHSAGMPICISTLKERPVALD